MLHATEGSPQTATLRLPGLIRVSGEPVRYQNAAFPTLPDGSLVAPLATCVCAQCGHGYAALMTDAADDVKAGVPIDDAYFKPRKCAECRLGDWMLDPAHQVFRDGAGAAYVDDLEFFISTMSSRRDNSGRKSVARITY